MSLHVCAGCSASYAVGLPACPECGSADVRGGGDLPVPAVQVACRAAGCRARDQVRRVRLAAVDRHFVQAPDLRCAACGSAPEIVTPWPPEGDHMPKITKHGGPSNALADPPSREPTDTEEVASSPGNSSQTSSEKPEPSQPTKPADSPKRARTTGSRSKRARTDSSSASGTGGDPTEATSESG